MTKIHSINSNQLYLPQNAEVSLKLAWSTMKLTSLSSTMAMMCFMTVTEI